MGVLLASERQTTKGRLFLALVYAILTLGGVTMVLPFLVMLAASFSGPYDYSRHTPYVKALFNRNDRFMRSIATYFPRFPREVFPEAPESWSSWLSVARDPAGVDAFAARHLQPALADSATRAAWREKALRFRDHSAACDITRTTCNYDARDVPAFVKAKYGTIEKLNDEWPVKFRGFSASA